MLTNLSYFQKICVSIQKFSFELFISKVKYRNYFNKQFQKFDFLEIFNKGEKMKILLDKFNDVIPLETLKIGTLNFIL